VNRSARRGVSWSRCTGTSLKPSRWLAPGAGKADLVCVDKLQIDILGGVRCVTRYLGRMGSVSAHGINMRHQLSQEMALSLRPEIRLTDHVHAMSKRRTRALVAGG
jgi:hypothetical protein